MRNTLLLLRSSSSLSSLGFKNVNVIHHTELFKEKERKKKKKRSRLRKMMKTKVKDDDKENEKISKEKVTDKERQKMNYIN